MIVFLHEDRAYLYWVAHHRGGFVLDASRKPTKSHQVLHRATCGEIKSSESKHTHWTTGNHVKACAVNPEELKAWAMEQIGAGLTPCALCHPDVELQHGEAGHEAEPHLTRLAREIISFVLEVSTIHLDEEMAISLQVGAIARCLNKSPGQLTGPLIKLVDEGLLTIRGSVEPGTPIAANRGVFPTARTLRTLPAYSNVEDCQIEADLQKLRGE